MLVAEATLSSGSLITACMAAEQNRKVFAVPGSIESAKSLGIHALIKQGAKLVDKTTLSSDTQPRPKTQIPLSSAEELVYFALDAYPIHIDDIAQKIRMTVHEISSTVLTLEIKGLIRQMPGRYILKTELV